MPTKVCYEDTEPPSPERVEMIKNYMDKAIFPVCEEIFEKAPSLAEAIENCVGLMVSSLVNFVLSLHRYDPDKTERLWLNVMKVLTVEMLERFKEQREVKYSDEQDFEWLSKASKRKG